MASGPQSKSRSGNNDWQMPRAPAAAGARAKLRRCSKCLRRYWANRSAGSRLPSSSCVQGRLPLKRLIRLRDNAAGPATTIVVYSYSAGLGFSHARSTATTSTPTRLVIDDPRVCGITNLSCRRVLRWHITWLRAQAQRGAIPTGMPRSSCRASGRCRSEDQSWLSKNGWPAHQRAAHRYSCATRPALQRAELRGPDA